MRVSADRFDETTVYADLNVDEDIDGKRRGMEESNLDHAVAFARRARAKNIEIWRKDLSGNLRFEKRLQL